MKKKKAFTVPSDLTNQMSVHNLLLNYSYINITPKAKRTQPLPPWFSRGVRESTLKNITAYYENIRRPIPESMIEIALDTGCSIPTIKKLYAICNTTEDSYLPEISPGELLPLYMLKILKGDIDREERIETPNGLLNIGIPALFPTMSGDSGIKPSSFGHLIENGGFKNTDVLHWLNKFAVDVNGVAIYKQYYESDLKLYNTLRVDKNTALRDVSKAINNSEFKLSDDQKGAFNLMKTGNKVFLKGRPGSGKTSCGKGMANIVTSKDSEILALAPTNKAKIRLGESSFYNTGFTHTIGQYEYDFTGPHTIHSLGNRVLKARKEIIDVLKKVKVLVIDEVSMCGSEHSNYINAIIDACEPEAVIFLGDPDQLTPVGLGSLIDILEASEIPQTTLTTCHRSVKDIYNFCSNLIEESGIEREHPLVYEVANSEVHSQDKGYSSQATEKIKEFWDNNYNSEKPWDTIGMAYTNKAVNRFNLIIQTKLLKEGVIGDEEDFEDYKHEFRSAYSNGTVTPLFFKGDMVISTSNVRRELPNGMRALVKEVQTTTYGEDIVQYAVLQVIDEKNTILKKVKLDRNCFKLAYACTVHQMQGDQAETAIYIYSTIDTDSLAYTAASRPTKNLYVLVPTGKDAFIPLEERYERKSTMHYFNKGE